MAEAVPAVTGRVETATLGAGCFWCVEAVFKRTDGIIDVESGFMGGHVENPTYEQVCTGETGHAEVLRVRFDPSRISYSQVLDVFWHMHDPTTPNRQGADVGTQYRSVVFYHDAGQRRAAEAKRRELDASGAFDRPIVTQIEAASTFHPAEKYHQDYYDRNAGVPYCRFVIAPKLRKLGLEGVKPGAAAAEE